MSKKDYLEHFGVLGMKWGRRKSGSRSDTLRKKVASKTGSTDYEKAKSLRKKKLKDMSNDEVRTLVNRMNLEGQYKAAIDARRSKGRKRVDSILKKVGDRLITTAINIGERALLSQVNAQYKKHTDLRQHFRR